MKWFKQKNVVVTFDFSDDSVEAVRVALEIANSHNEVHIVHAVSPLPANDPYVVWNDEIDQQRKKFSRDSIKEALSALPNEGYHIHVEVGGAAEVIIDVADELDAGMILIPSHGKTGLKRFLLGSVAEKVVRLSERPVLVLKSAPEPT